jgi:hypothetical protein
MTKSSDELEIRSYVVSRLRTLMPSARIVHELNVAGQGTNRIDVAAVTPIAIVGVEIKSKKDTLKRLDEQLKAFRQCCHFVIVAAHEKHFAEWRSEHWRDDVPSESQLNHPLFFGERHRFGRHVWRYPVPEPILGQWRTDFDPHKDLLTQPRAAHMLDMLWASELHAECHRHRVSCNSRSTRGDMIRDMVWLMTGKEICHAVCRQLRGRVFAEADPPIFETTASPSVTRQGQAEMLLERTAS